MAAHRTNRNKVFVMKVIMDEEVREFMSKCACPRRKQGQKRADEIDNKQLAKLPEALCIFHPSPLSYWSKVGSQIPI